MWLVPDTLLRGHDITRFQSSSGEILVGSPANKAPSVCQARMVAWRCPSRIKKTTSGLPPHLEGKRCAEEFFPRWVFAAEPNTFDAVWLSEKTSALACSKASTCGIFSTLPACSNSWMAMTASMKNAAGAAMQHRAPAAGLRHLEHPYNYLRQ